MYEAPDYAQNRIPQNRRNLNLSPSNIKGCVAKLEKRDSEIVHISKHALGSFARDTKKYHLEIDTSSRKKSLENLCIRLKNAEEVERRNAVRQIIKHDFEIVNYFYNHGWIFVVSNERVLKTANYVGSLRRDLYRFKRDN